MLTAAAILVAVPARAEWTHAGGDAARTATAPRGPRALDDVGWTSTPHGDEEFVAQSTPIAAFGRVYVNARAFDDDVHFENRLICYEARSGRRLWAEPVEADAFDSWSSPAADVRNNTVILATGTTVHALDAASGAVLWETPLDGPVVNASPAVTTGLFSGPVPANRVLITDFDSAGQAARLYAINVDPNEPPHNPYRPGEIVWSLTIGRASGASPAYGDGVAYVASGAGNVLAIDVLNPPPDPNRPGEVRPIWRTQVDLMGASPDAGFFGGVELYDGALFAASYEFFGGENAGRLFKLDAASGDVRWATFSERTSSIPIRTDTQQVLLSGGVAGFGSRIKLQSFTDAGSSALPGWDTGQSQPPMGGWTHQPAVAGSFMYVGSPKSGAGDFFGPYERLHIVDFGRDPNDEGFVRDSFHGAGGSPALAYGRLFSVGRDGLVAFEPSPACLADIDGSGAVDVNDLTILLAVFGSERGDAAFNAEADLDISGRIDVNDLTTLLASFGRRCE